MRSYAQWGNALYSGEKSYRIVPNRKWFVGISGAVVVLACILVALVGVRPSIEFTGGSEFSVVGTDSSNQQAAYDATSAAGVTSNVRVSSLGTSGLRVQTPSLTPEQTAQVRSELAKAYGVADTDVQATSIGPSWGADVTSKALKSLVIFLVLVGAMMAIYFRSWTMSVAALAALFHDIALTLVVFSITRVEVSPATVIGFLTILGYSLYDTVVVFDKVRELTKGVHDQRRYTYAELVNLAINQTLVRSINTSVVALLPVAAILVIATVLLGAGTLTDISLALFVGMLVGTYSSIFIASPLLVMLEHRRKKTVAHNELVAKDRKQAAGADTSEEDDKVLAAVDVKVSPVVPGHHLGQSAQPHRKNRKK